MFRTSKNYYVDMGVVYGSRYLGVFERTKNMQTTMQVKKLMHEYVHARSERLRKKYLNDVLVLDPGNVDVKRLQIRSKGRQRLLEMEKLEQEARADWKKVRVTRETRVGDYDYLTLRYELAQLYLQESLFLEAEKSFRFLMTVDSDDSLGCRHKLFAIYCWLYRWEDALRLYRKHPGHQSDDQVLFYMMIVAVLTHHEKEAVDFYQRLKTYNPYIQDFFQALSGDFDRLERAWLEKGFIPNTFESLVDASFDIYELLERVEGYFLGWLEDQEPKAIPQQVIAPDLLGLLGELGATPEEALYNVTTGMERVIGLQNPLYKGLPLSAKEALYDAGIRTKQDFAKWKSSDVAALKGIGSKSIQKLKAKGIGFKK